MIKGMHGLFYTEDPVAAREFLRDKLGFPAHDVGDGWLIFDIPEADLGCHPPEAGRTHKLSFYCDDLAATVAELEAKGVACSPVVDRGYGLASNFELPGGGPIELYQPRYRKG